MTAAAQLLDAVVPIVRTRLPRGVDIDYLDDFVDRNRLLLEAVIEQNLGPMLRRMEAANNASFVQEDIPEFWTAAKRTAANVAAMATAANLYAQKRAPGHEERTVLAGYSGWGGLSIQAAAGRFPPGFPAPEERGLVQERVRLRNFETLPDPSAARPSSCRAQARPRRHCPVPPALPAPATHPSRARPRRGPGSRPPAFRCPR
jgi:hypothetical protein